MKRQALIQSQKETMPPQMRGLLPHAAVRTTPDHDMPSNVSAETRFGHDFSQVTVRPSAPVISQDYSNASCPLFPQRCPFGGACHTCPPRVQAKLKVGQAGDKYEQEADWVAEQVMRTTVDKRQKSEVSNGNTIQEQKEEPIQAKQADGQTLQVGSKLKDQINAQRSSGKPLNPFTRAFMEPRFGADFDHVRLHTDEEAHQTASQIKARAFTYGNHIWLGKGESEHNRRLIAHELTHVVHQGSAAPSGQTSQIINRININPRIQRVPSISSWVFKNTDTTSGDNCCAICPVDLDLDIRPARGYHNGMELKAFISDHDPAYSYDIKRTKHRKISQKVGGTWTTRSEVGPDAPDDIRNTDECLIPQVTPPSLHYIYSEDRPGVRPRALGWADAAATDVAYIANFTEFVQISDGTTTTDDPLRCNWHTVSWASKVGGNWTFVEANSEIELDHRASVDP